MRNKSKWKKNFKNWISNAQREIIRTSVIGKKLITASRTNAHLKETYEEMGRLLEEAMDSGEVKWDSAKIRALLHSAKACKKDLKELNDQVYKIRFSAGPEDISKKEID